MRTGGCLCGAVRYEIDGPLREILVCHCVECRHWAGHAWAATAAALTDIRIDGEVVWRGSPRSEWNAKRGNCMRCSACLFWHAEDGERMAIGAGTLDDPNGLRVGGHIWIEQGADWERPPEGMPAYPRGYPDDAPALGWRT